MTTILDPAIRASKIKPLSLIFGVMFVLYALFLISFSRERNYRSNEPNIQIKIDNESILISENLGIIYQIAHSLNDYKNIHRMYPKNNGNEVEWVKLIIDGNNILFGSFYSTSLNETPNSGIALYYKSNGANYKLLTKNPRDCEKIRSWDIWAVAFFSPTPCEYYGVWTTYETGFWE